MYHTIWIRFVKCGNRVVWLENHTVKMFGDVKEVCDAYRL